MGLAGAIADIDLAAHFMEHIRSPNNVLSEIGRVCRDGARIEIWTPYAFSDEAFVYGHETYLTELPWLHFCVSHRDTHAPLLNGRWQLERVVYVVDPEVRAEIEATGTPVGFAIRYWKGVVTEFGVEIRYRSDMDAPVVVPERVWTHARHGAERFAVDTPAPVPPAAPAASGLARDVARKVVPDRLKPPLHRVVGRVRRWASGA